MSKIEKTDHFYLIDGSGYIFRAYYALPPLTRKSDGLPTGAVSGFCSMLFKLLEDSKSNKNLQKPTHFAVIFDSARKTFRNEIYTHKVGYVPQKISIDWTLPLRVNDFMVLTESLNKETIDEALSLTGVIHLKDKNLGDLSGGEFQRVLLARAISKKPELLVLDEPVQGVDFTGEIALYELIKKISDELSCGILLISHDLHTVMSATDHVVCLNGHVCCSGSPMDVAKNNEYKALFGEQASQILSRYEHKHDHVHTDEGEIKKN